MVQDCHVSGWKNFIFYCRRHFIHHNPPLWKPRDFQFHVYEKSKRWAYDIINWLILKTNCLKFLWYQKTKVERNLFTSIRIDTLSHFIYKCPQTNTNFFWRLRICLHFYTIRNSVGISGTFFQRYHLGYVMADAM